MIGKVDQHRVNKHATFLISLLIRHKNNIISSFFNSAAGYDEIPASIMKQLINYYAEPLTHLINQSILQCLLPEEMKIAKVIPIYKCEDKQLVTNYRPI